MPYRSVDELPSSVKDAIADNNGKRIFMNVANSQLAAGKSDSVAFASAWSTLQRDGYKKGDDGKWHKIEKSLDFTIKANILKSSDELGLVYGWASVIEENGDQVADYEGDVIDEDELVKAAHQFMTDYRDGKENHKGSPSFTIVESMVLTKDVQQALGINLNKVGWFIAGKIEDPEIRQKIKMGEYQSFSIGGQGKREPFDA